jgi:hypothetical protein
MKNPSKMNELLQRYSPVYYEEQQKLAEQYLHKITLLQELLKIEEQKLIQLLRDCGVWVVNS